MKTAVSLLLSVALAATTLTTDAFRVPTTPRMVQERGAASEAAGLRSNSGSDLSRGAFLKSALALGGGLVVTTLASPALAVPASEAPDLNPILLTYEGKPKRFGDLLGKKATLLVNVASYCALTGGNYPGLVDLYERYHDKGLEIVGVGCNQFGSQEPEKMTKVRKDMQDRFGVQFPLMDKIDVNGPNAHPLYAALKKYEPELSGYPPKISWNFEKFLIGPDGTPLRRYRPGVDPLEVEPDIKALIETGKVPVARKRSLNDF